MQWNGLKKWDHQVVSVIMKKVICEEVRIFDLI